MSRGYREGGNKQNEESQEGRKEGTDCQAERTTYEVLDLMETDDCPERQRQYSQPVTKKARVLLAGGKKRIEGFVCRSLISRLAAKCGLLDDHIYGVRFISWREPQPISRQQCIDIIKTKNYWFRGHDVPIHLGQSYTCLLYTSPSPRDRG